MRIDEREKSEEPFELFFQQFHKNGTVKIIVFFFISFSTQLKNLVLLRTKHRFSFKHIYSTVVRSCYTCVARVPRFIVICSLLGTMYCDVGDEGSLAT